MKRFLNVLGLAALFGTSFIHAIDLGGKSLDGYESHLVNLEKGLILNGVSYPRLVSMPFSEKLEVLRIMLVGGAVEEGFDDGSVSGVSLPAPMYYTRDLVIIEDELSTAGEDYQNYIREPFGDKQHRVALLRSEAESSVGVAPRVAPKRNWDDLIVPPDWGEMEPETIAALEELSSGVSAHPDTVSLIPFSAGLTSSLPTISSVPSLSPEVLQELYAKSSVQTLPLTVTASYSTAPVAVTGGLGLEDLDLSFLEGNAAPSSSSAVAGSNNPFDSMTDDQFKALGGRFSDLNSENIQRLFGDGEGGVTSPGKVSAGVTSSVSAPANQLSSVSSAQGAARNRNLKSETARRIFGDRPQRPYSVKQQVESGIAAGMAQAFDGLF